MPSLLPTVQGLSTARSPSCQTLHIGRLRAIFYRAYPRFDSEPPARVRVPYGMTNESTAVYLRVSTDEQRERQTIETQRQEAARYCELRRMSIQAVYEDDGISGTVPFHDRPQGTALWRDIAAGVRALHAVKNRTDDNKQLISIERLGDVSINSGAKAFDAVGSSVFRGQENNWNKSGARAFAELTRERVTIHTGHPYIADDQVGQRFGDAHQCFRAG